MEKPSIQDRITVVENRMRDLQNQHYQLELDKVAAEATGAQDAAEVLIRLNQLQEQVEKAYTAMQKVRDELHPLSVPAEA